MVFCLRSYYAFDMLQPAIVGVTSLFHCYCLGLHQKCSGTNDFHVPLGYIISHDHNPMSPTLIHDLKFRPFVNDTQISISTKPNTKLLMQPNGKSAFGKSWQWLSTQLVKVGDIHLDTGGCSYLASVFPLRLSYMPFQLTVLSFPI